MTIFDLQTPVLETIRQRRSLRRYRPDPVARAVIETLLNAAIWAPSAHNRQPWRFAVIVEAAPKQRLARAMGARLRHDLQADDVPEDVIAADVARSYQRLTGAPVLIMLCLSMVDMDMYADAPRAQHEAVMAAQSVAMAGQNLMLAAHELGLATCWMCAPLFCPDVVRAALELPDDWQPQGVITLGYAAQERTKTRHPLEKSVLWR
ncbi:MAG: nitroreductase family protein [Chloroflexi bacterium]|nr:nitroreductase family protein [Chloroflexota bacterium]